MNTLSDVSVVPPKRDRIFLNRPIWDATAAHAVNTTDLETGKKVRNVSHQDANQLIFGWKMLAEAKARKIRTFDLLDRTGMEGPVLVLVCTYFGSKCTYFGPMLIWIIFVYKIKLQRLTIGTLTLPRCNPEVVARVYTFSVSNPCSRVRRKFEINNRVGSSANELKFSGRNLWAAPEAKCAWLGRKAQYRRRPVADYVFWFEIEY